MFGGESVYVSMTIAPPPPPLQKVLMQKGAPTTIPVYPRLSSVLLPTVTPIVEDDKRFDLDAVARMPFAQFCDAFDMNLLPLPTYDHSKSAIRRTCAVSGSYNSESPHSFKEFLYGNLELLRYETIATIRSIIMYQEDVCVREMQKYETKRYNELLSVVIMLTDMYPTLLYNDIAEIYNIMTQQMSFDEFVAKIQSRHEDVKTCVKDVVDRKQADLDEISDMLSVLKPGLSPRKMYVLYDKMLKIEMTPYGVASKVKKNYAKLVEESRVIDEFHSAAEELQMSQYEECAHEYYAGEARQLSQFEIVYDMMNELTPGYSWSELREKFDEMLYYMSFDSYRVYLETEISNMDVETDDDEVAQPKADDRPISFEDIAEVDEHVIQHLYEPAFCVWVEEHGEEYPVCSRVGLYYLYENAMRMLEMGIAPYSLSGIMGMEDEYDEEDEEENDGFCPYNGEEVERQPAESYEHGHFRDIEEVFDLSAPDEPPVKVRRISM
jgi:hypothetical protein